jgi:hypothetical protein
MGAAAVIVIIIILLVIIGGGVGAYFLLKEDDKPKTGTGSGTTTGTTSGTPPPVIPPAATTTPPPVIPPPVIPPAPIMPQPGPWKNLKVSDKSYVPIRTGMNINGYVECMSANRWDCFWRETSAEVDALIANPPPQGNAIYACDEDDTNNKEHWCYKGMKQLNPTSPKLPPAYIRYYMKNNYLHY